jgi:hypothetical protein
MNPVITETQRRLFKQWREDLNPKFVKLKVYKIDLSEEEKALIDLLHPSRMGELLGIVTIAIIKDEYNGRIYHVEDMHRIGLSLCGPKELDDYSKEYGRFKALARTRMFTRGARDAKWLLINEVNKDNLEAAVRAYAIEHSVDWINNHHSLVIR